MNPRTLLARRPGRARTGHATVQTRHEERLPASVLIVPHCRNRGRSRSDGRTEPRRALRRVDVRDGAANSASEPACSTRRVRCAGFWARRWNRGFARDDRVVRAATLGRRLGRSRVAGSFLASVCYELAISLPVGAGYGHRPHYFVFGAHDPARERSSRALATLLKIALPLPLVFHPWFVAERSCRCSFEPCRRRCVRGSVGESRAAKPGAGSLVRTSRSPSVREHRMVHNVTDCASRHGQTPRAPWSSHSRARGDAAARIPRRAPRSPDRNLREAVVAPPGHRSPRARSRRGVAGVRTFASAPPPATPAARGGASGARGSRGSPAATAMAVRRVVRGLLVAVGTCSSGVARRGDDPAYAPPHAAAHFTVQSHRTEQTRFALLLVAVEQPVGAAEHDRAAMPERHVASQDNQELP